MPRYLAAHPLAPKGVRTWRDALTGLAEAARDLGVRPIETLFDAEGSNAWTLWDAPDERAIREAHTRAQIEAPRSVLPVEHVFTELLAEPRRERYA